MGFFRSLKDKAVEKIAAAYLASKMNPYGKILLLNLDSAARSVIVEVHLHGEDRPHRMMLKGYQLDRTPEGKCRFMVENAETDRAWLTQVMKDYLVGKEFVFPMPTAAWKVVEMLL